MLLHRFEDTIPKYAKTFRHLLSTVDEIVKGAASANVVAV